MTTPYPESASQETRARETVTASTGARRSLDVARAMLPVLLFVATNGLYVYKYSAGLPVFQQHWYAFGYAAVMLTAFVIYDRLRGRLAFTRRTAGILLALSLLAFGAVALVILGRVDRHGVDVDRWSAIENFLAYLFAGRYPYDATTHLGQYASPFPLWEAFHIPFYLLGDVGYAQIFVFAASVIAIAFLARDTRVALVFAAVMLISPAFWYEVTVRSDLLSNMLVALVFVALVGYRRSDALRRPNIVAVAAGSLLATRLLVAIPLVVALGADYWRLLRAEPRRILLASAVAILVFALTFLPFVLWDMDRGAFFRHNPFVLQANKIDPIIVVVFGLVGLWLSFRTNTLYATLLGIAVTLGAMMLVYVAMHVLTAGWQAAIMGDRVDLAYTATALPFALLAYAIKVTPDEPGTDHQRPGA